MTPRARASWMQATGEIVRHADYGAGHRWLDLAVPDDFTEPVAGQFVQLLLAPTASAVLLPRPMSVAGVMRKRGRLVVQFLYAPVGVGTHSLAALAPGCTVDVLGPLGRGYPLETPGTPVLIAGGRGVAPLLFAADALAGGGRPVEFIFGARDAARLVGLEDAEARVARARGRLYLCTDDGSRGMRGDVVKLLDTLAKSLPTPPVIHACGPHAMLNAVARWGLRRQAKTFLAMEAVMACGTGVCRGCPLPRSAAGREAFDPRTTPSLYGNREFAMCCTEGPVFEAAALDWDRIE